MEDEAHLVFARGRRSHDQTDYSAFMAERMGAKIRSHSVDHTPMYTEQNIVVDIISEALRETLSKEVSARSAS
jgi:hypothetical protein